MYVEILMAIGTVILLGFLQLYERRRNRRPNMNVPHGWCPPMFPFRDADATKAPTNDPFKEYYQLLNMAGKPTQLPELPKLPVDERMYFILLSLY